MANFLLTIAIFASIYTFQGEYISPPRVDGVLPNSAAAEAGLQEGDVIKSIDGTTVDSFSDIQRIVFRSGASTLQMTVERDGRLVEVAVTPRVETVEDGFGGETRRPRLGVQHDPSTQTGARHVTYDPVTALWLGVKQTWFIIDTTLSYVGRLILGAESPDELGGPVRIAKMSGDVAELGLVPLINLAALISASIGLINLFPVPMLDGGHLLFYAFEAVRGKPLGERAQEMGFKVGLVLVLSLMVFATWNDFVQLRVFETLSGLLS